MRCMAAATLWQRELVRFVRQRSRLFSAIATPLLFWVLLGSGLGSSFRLPGAEGVGYGEYFFPGTAVLLVLFASIFSSISLIEDRQTGFLQGVLVAPVGPSALVLGKVLGGATIAWLQGTLYLMLAPLAGIPLTWAVAAGASGVLLALSIALTALGFGFAWRVDSTQGFHAVMNLVLMPMWLLSGAFFPVTGAPAWLEAIMRLNPLTYGMAALRRVLAAGEASPEMALETALPSLGPSLGIVLFWCAVGLLFAGMSLRRAR